MNISRLLSRARTHSTRTSDCAWTITTIIIIAKVLLYLLIIITAGVPLLLQLLLQSPPLTFSLLSGNAFIDFKNIKSCVLKKLCGVLLGWVGNCKLNNDRNLSWNTKIQAQMLHMHLLIDRCRLYNAAFHWVLGFRVGMGAEQYLILRGVRVIQ